MKKILTILPLIMVLCIFQGCKNKKNNNIPRKHVYYTYYGLVDLDTVTDIQHWDNKKWYRVRYSEKDSFDFDGEWKYIYGPINNYYCPTDNSYIQTEPDNQGRIMVTDMYWLK